MLSRSQPLESRKALSQFSQNLFELVPQLKPCPDLAVMYTYKRLERVLNGPCNLTGGQDNPVVLTAPKEIASDSLLNPSDPDATDRGHQGPD